MNLYAISHLSLGVVIEEITEEATVSSDNCESSRSKSSISSPQETNQSKSSRSANIAEPQLNHDYFKALKDDPESIRFIAVNLFLPFSCAIYKD